MSVKYREAFCELLCEACPSHSLMKCALKKKIGHRHDNDTIIGGRRKSSMADTYTIYEDGGYNCDRSSVTLTLTTFDSDDSDKSNGNETITGKCINMLETMKTPPSSASSPPFQSYNDQINCLQIPKPWNHKYSQDSKKLNFNSQEAQLKNAMSIVVDSDQPDTKLKVNNKHQIPSFTIHHFEHETDL